MVNSIEKNKKLTREETRKFCHDNSYATLMLMGAEDAYVSARCLILNFLITRGLGLATEAIEKVLKAILFLKDKKIPPNIHDTFKLKELLKAENNFWNNLNQYDLLLQKLFGHYQHRYHDNKNASKNMSSDELSEIDNLWFFLWDNLPVPNEVKFTTSFFYWLFEKDNKDSVLSQKRKFFITEENDAFKKRRKELEIKYNMTIKQLYPIVDTM